jgi:hypothetical protein
MQLWRQQPQTNERFVAAASSAEWTRPLPLVVTNCLDVQTISCAISGASIESTNFIIGLLFESGTSATCFPCFGIVQPLELLARQRPASVMYCALSAVLYIIQDNRSCQAAMFLSDCLGL